MADILATFGSQIGTFSWAGMGQIVFIITIFLLGLILIGIIMFILWWKSYYLQVKVYEPYGQVNFTDKELRDIKEEGKQGLSKTLTKKDIKFDTIKIKRTHGKFLTTKGNPYFATFMPFRKHEPVPMEMLFDDGIHLLRISRELFIPIPKPKTIVSVGEAISISVTENNRWKVWNNMQAEKINSKYQDTDVLKRATLYFVVGIVALVLIGGFILWLMYSSANKGWDAAEKFNTVAESLLGGNKPS